MKDCEPLSTPVLFIIYDRADTALQVFDTIKRVQPANLFIASDGPAERYEDEKNNVLSLRQNILNNIDWKCNVKTFFGEKNLGPRIWISSAINWFFNNVEEGIILEHDCLPDVSFFFFCQELLSKYRLDNRVMHISGANFLFENTKLNSSYYLSKYPFIWGWATWKRAWEKYDADLSQLEEFLSLDKLRKMFKSKIEIDYWDNIFRMTKNKRFNTWDYQWIFSIWQNDGISLNASVNLVSNIGYGKEAVNTNYTKTVLANIALSSIEKLIYPFENKIDETADRISFEHYFGEYLNNLFNQNDYLQKICDERLNLIHELVKTADERLKIIEALSSELKKTKNEKD